MPIFKLSVLQPKNASTEWSYFA